MHNTVEVQIHLDNTKARLTASIGVIVRGWIYMQKKKKKEMFQFLGEKYHIWKPGMDFLS